MNITTFTINNFDNTTTDWVKIDWGNNEFTSMLKSTYDTLVSNSSTPQAGN